MDAFTVRELLPPVKPVLNGCKSKEVSKTCSRASSGGWALPCGWAAAAQVAWYAATAAFTSGSQAAGSCTASGGGLAVRSTTM